MLFHVDVASGDVTRYLVASDGILCLEDQPSFATGLRREGDHVVYTLSLFPAGRMIRIKTDGLLRLPIEQVVFQKDGFADNAFWTKDGRLAKIVGRAVTFAKERAYRAARPY